MTLRIAAAQAAARVGGPLRGVAHRLVEPLADEPELVPAVARIATGARMAVDLRDHAQRHVFVHGILDESTTALFRRTIVAGDVVLDVGANAGYYTLLACDLGARVHAFEPQPRQIALLRRSIELNGFAQATAVEAACGEEPGTARLYESTDPAFGGMASLVERRYTLSSDAPFDVRVVTVDGWCEEHDLRPRLVKIDVEGFEAEVVAGMRATLERSRPLVVCEVAFGDGRERRVLGALQAAGYERHTIETDGTLGGDGEDPPPGTNVDFCFVPRR